MIVNNLTFSVFEDVDCIDETGNWRNAKVQDTTSDRVKVSYSGYSSRFDRWVPNSPDWVLKQ